jgi:hypothetical protein
MTYRSLSAQEIEKIQTALSEISVSGAIDCDIVQYTYDAMLKQPVMKPRDIEILGYAFGHLMLQHDWLIWKMLIDEKYGDEISIAVTWRQLGCSPLSMIRNRLEDREACNIQNLLELTFIRLRQLGQHSKSENIA